MDTEMMIRNLKKVEEDHKDDKVFTGQLNIAEMARDVRKRLEELKPYEGIGLTPEQIMELAERDIPKKVKINAGIPRCPVCGRRVIRCYYFCPNCGQRILRQEIEMTTAREWIEKVHEITDTLEHQANTELQKATSYHKGYMQACEDFGREMRRLISEERGEED